MKQGGMDVTQKIPKDKEELKELIKVSFIFSFLFSFFETLISKKKKKK